MPLAPEQQAVADELIALYREAQDSLQQQLARAVVDPNRVSQVARLRALATAVHELRVQLEDATRLWFETRLPAVHAAGAMSAAGAVGSSFSWTQPHLSAVQALAETKWTDVAANLRGMEEATRAALQALARDAGREALLEGATAVQAGKDLSSWMVDRGIGTVTYANGAEHLAADYAETVARTTTASAYNTGTFAQARGDGFEWMEAVDGADCGLTEHDDPEKADGNVYPIDVAEENDLAHPNCARSWTPRPDITSQEEADAAGPDAGDALDAALAERERAASATTTLSGRARAGRQPRAPRVARSAR